MDKTLSQTRGTEGERIAREYLTKLKYQILATNEYTHWGEIDIIARDQSGVTIFVEVKAKGSLRYGTPEDAFNFRKKEKLKRAIDWYCLKHDIPEGRMRVDLIAIEYSDEGTKLRHYKNVSLA